MNYAIVNSGMVENIIVAEPEVAAWIKESIDEEFKPILEVS